MKTKVEYVLEAERLVGDRTPRSCAVCCLPAVFMAMRGIKGRELQNNTLRFACERHVSLAELWPQRVVVTLEPLGEIPAHGFSFGTNESRWIFYRDLIAGMGGKMPEMVRDEETKKRKRDWQPPVEGPTLKPCRAHHRTRKVGGISGRQWVKLRKKMGYAAKAR